jgi:hypothetical protein
MRTGLPLWDAAPAARRRDPGTSQQAALRTPVLRGRDRIRALHIHAAHCEGLTDFELARLMADRKQTSAGKRRGELRDLGLIAKTSITRPSDTGSPAIVWKITPSGIATAKQFQQQE